MQHIQNKDSNANIFKEFSSLRFLLCECFIRIKKYILLYNIHLF